MNQQVNKEKAGGVSTAVPHCLRGMMLPCHRLGRGFWPLCCGEVGFISFCLTLERPWDLLLPIDVAEVTLCNSQDRV